MPLGKSGLTVNAGSAPFRMAASGIGDPAGKPRRACYCGSMTPRNAALLLIAPLALSACASAAPSHYPSLALRDFERVKGAGTPAEPAPAPPPPPAIQPDEALSSRLQKLQAQAREAHGSFMAAAPGARSAVAGASGAAPGSDRWIAAEVAVSNLESTRARAMVALADLDDLQVSAALEDGAIEAITAAHTAVADLLAQEDRVIDELVGKLEG